MTLAEGCTSLHLAALRLSAPDIRTALRAGDDPNALDAIGRTPLCCAVGRLDTGDTRFREAWATAVIALIDAGANVDARRYHSGPTLRSYLPAWLCTVVAVHESERLALKFDATLAAPVDEAAAGRVRL